ncbi:MAG: hypothetical protein L3J39_12210 [Verrucomicrobiales bacterium]|nr:hypothetical protein [Verrucomicrobiales bacterium]
MAKSGNIWIKAGSWIFLAAGLLAVLLGSAWLGVSLAKKDLPEWVGKSDVVLRGEKVMIGGGGEAIYVAEKNQKIKDFFNKYKTVEKRAKADIDASRVRRLTAEVRVRVKRRDAGTASIEVLSGPLNGEVFWMPVSQLVKKQKSEDLPLIKDDGLGEEVEGEREQRL